MKYPDWLLPNRLNHEPKVSREHIMTGRWEGGLRVRCNGVVYDSINACGRAIGRSWVYIYSRCQDKFDGFEWVKGD